MAVFVWTVVSRGLWFVLAGFTVGCTGLFCLHSTQSYACKCESRSTGSTVNELKY